MFLDDNHWGRDEADFVVTFERDQYIGSTSEGIAPLLVEENYRVETRFLCIRRDDIADTTDFKEAAIFPDRHEAARAVQWHRQECGDRGQLYDIRPV